MWREGGREGEWGYVWVGGLGGEAMSLDLSAHSKHPSLTLSSSPLFFSFFKLLEIMNQQHQTVTASVADTDPRYHYTPHHISSSSSSSSSRTPSNHSSSDSSSTSTSTTRSSSATLVFRNNSHHHIVGGYQPYPKSIPSSTAVQPPPLSTSTTNTSVTCHWQDCGNVFDTELDVYNHIVARHAVKGKQECLMTRADSTLCRTSFMNKGNFIDHISSHFSSKLKPYACEVKYTVD